MRVIVTGGGTSGHVNPALAIANTIKKNIPDSEIIFVGTGRGIENKLSLSLSNIKSLYLALTSPLKARRLIREFKPDVVVGTGGYVCWPVMKAAADMKIPTVLHESNSIPGVAIKMLAKYVDLIFVNFEATIDKFPEKYRGKTQRVGNPLRPEFLKLDCEKAREQLGITGKYEKFILSCGGSMGAEKVNEAALKLMKEYTSLHPEVLHLHATGSIEYETALAEFRRLGLDKCENLKLVEYIYDMPLQMAAADALICRAGAMTLSELAILGKAAVLIPSPNVTDNHQFFNAKALVDKNAAVMIEEKDLNNKIFCSTINNLLENNAKRSEMSGMSKKMGIKNSNELIYNEIKKLTS